MPLLKSLLLQFERDLPLIRLMTIFINKQICFIPYSVNLQLERLRFETSITTSSHKKIVRDWALKHAYDQRKANLANSRRRTRIYRPQPYESRRWSFVFPKWRTHQLSQTFYCFQEQDQEEKSRIVSDAITGKAMYLISHRMRYYRCYWKFFKTHLEQLVMPLLMD